MLEKPTVVLSDGNAFAILGTCQRAATRAGWSKEQIDKFMDEAQSDDYNHLLQVVQSKFHVELKQETNNE